MNDYTIACVYKTGGEFKAEHVKALSESILEYNDVPIKCLTDDKSLNIPGVEVVPLEHGWPGWWSKLELFKHDFGPTLYMDLDTVVIGELPPIQEGFTMLRGMYRPNSLASGLMSWTDTPRYLYEEFQRAPEAHQKRYSNRRKPDRWGDQGFIHDHVREPVGDFGKEFRSYKVHCKDGIPEGTKVVFFHGKPRPWEVVLNTPTNDVWFVIASGPSLTQEDVDAVRGKGRVIAVNNAVAYAPFCDYLYAADKRWWDQYYPKWFEGKKLTVSRYAHRWGAEKLSHEGFRKGFGKNNIRLGGDGSNSGFQALNYALLHRPKAIALLGFDHQHTGSKAHFHDDHPNHMPNAPKVDKWVEAMEAASNDTNGTKLVNCSRETALNCFERMDIQDFISEYC